MPLDQEGDSFCSNGPATQCYVHDQLVFTSDSCHSLLDHPTSAAVVNIEAVLHDARR
jgi:hypothetical protein